MEMNEYRVSAKDENLKKVQLFVQSCMEKYGCSEEIRIPIMIAVEEIFVNIAHYAYKGIEGEVCIRITNQPERSEFAKRNKSIKNIIVIQFLDYGMPYDPLKKPDPDITLNAEERNIGGLGIFMVKQSMDFVKYEHPEGSNLLTIEKSW